MSAPIESPEEFLAAFPVPMIALASTLRALVREACPGCIEEVKPGWRLIALYAPTVRKRIRFGFINPHNESVTLGFEYGIALRDAHLMRGGEDNLVRVRWLSLHSMRDYSRHWLLEQVREARDIALMPSPLRAGLVHRAHTAPCKPSGLDSARPSVRRAA